MSIVVAVAWAVLGLALLLVALPFRARASGSLRDGMPDGRAQVSWALGLLAVEADLGRTVSLRLAGVRLARLRLRTRMGRRDEDRPRRPAQAPARRKEGRPLARLRPALAGRGPLRRVVARLARALHLRARIAGTLGTGDPAETAALGALVAALGTVPGLDVALRLEWVEEALELDLELAARIWIAELLWVAAILLLSRANRRSLRLAFGRA